MHIRRNYNTLQKKKSRETWHDHPQIYWLRSCFGHLNVYEYGFRSTKLGCLNSNFGDSCYLFGNHHINPTRYDRSIRIHHMLEWPSLLWLDLIMAKVHFDALTSPQLLTQISAILGHIHHLTICHPCWVTPCGWGWRIEKMRGVEQQQELLVACILYIACISTCVYIYITCVCVCVQR